jgi:hypothetical protein
MDPIALLKKQHREVLTLLKRSLKAEGEDARALMEEIAGEEEMFPLAEKQLGREQLSVLGEELAARAETYDDSPSSATP